MFGQESRLKRTIGLFDATMIGLGAIVGAGIFVATGVAAASAGQLLPLAIVLAAVPATLNALSAAANAVAIPRSGGTYTFARELLSPAFGFVAGWLFIFATAVSDAAIAVGFGAYLGAVLPGAPPRLTALALVVAVVAVNYLGLRLVTWLNDLFTLLKVAVLLFFVGVGVLLLATGSPRHDIVAPVPISGVISGAALLFFAYPGYARITTLAEDVRDPARTIPRSVLLALGSAVLLYAVVTLVAVVLAGSNVLASSEAPLVVAISVANVGWEVAIIALGGVVATASVFLLDVTGLSRVFLAMARNRDVPSVLGRVNERTSTPRWAVLTVGAVVAVLTLTVDLSALIAATSFALLAYYVLTNAAALRLPPGARPFPALLPMLGILSCLGLIAFLPWPTILLGAGVVVVVSAAYVIKRRLTD